MQYVRDSFINFISGFITFTASNNDIVITVVVMLCSSVLIPLIRYLLKLLIKILVAKRKIKEEHEKQLEEELNKLFKEGEEIKNEKS